MIKVIVFDCDGVMFDSKPANQRYYNQLLDHFGKPPMDSDELAYVHSHSVTDGITHIFRNHQDVTMTSIDTYRKGLDYKEFIPYFAIEPDLKDFLQTVKGSYKLAISTNRYDTMDLLLETFDLSVFFGKVMTAANARRPKPAPDAMLEILEYYGVKAEEAILIGDSEVDQLHAKASGTTLVAFKNKELDTPYHITSFMQVLHLPLMKD